MIRFAELEPNPIRLTFKSNRIEILLESDTVGQTFDETMKITWYPGMGADKVEIVDGAVSSILDSRSDRRVNDLPFSATAVSPPPNSGDEVGRAEGRITYHFSIEAEPNERLLLRTVKATVAMEGQIDCPYAVTTSSPYPTTAVTLTREAVTESDLAALNGRGWEPDSRSVTPRGNGIRVFMGQELRPIRIPRKTEEMDLQITTHVAGRWRLSFVAVLSLSARGDASAELSAVESQRKPVVVYVVPICPY